MNQERQKYLDRFTASSRGRSLAGMHYDATYASKYWGKGGAIAIATALAEDIAEDGKIIQSYLLLLSTYYSAGGAAFELWKKAKWKFLNLFRAVANTWTARRQGEKIFAMFVDDGYRLTYESDAWWRLFVNLSQSELEVLMSPYREIAVKGKPKWLVSTDIFTAKTIGREVLKDKRNDNTMSYALIAGKMLALAEDTSEYYKLKLVVMKATENKNFAAKDRARLHIHLGEYEKARQLGQQEGLQDVMLKSGV